MVAWSGIGPRLGEKIELATKLYEGLPLHYREAV